MYSLPAGAHFHQTQDPLDWESAFSSFTGLVLSEVYVSLPWLPPPLEMLIRLITALAVGEHCITGILCPVLLNAFFVGSGLISFFFFFELAWDC